MGSYDYILAEKLVVPTQNLRYAQENLAGAQRSYEQNRARYNEYVSFKSSLDSLLGNLNSAYGKLGEALEYKKEGYSSEVKANVKWIGMSAIVYDDEIQFLYKYTDIAYDTTVTYEDEYGNKAYTKTPYIKEYGGYYKHYDYFTMKGTAMTKDGYVAYVYIDSREAQKDNINMFDRAMKNFFKSLNKTK